jgi:hypothetical protein
VGIKSLFFSDRFNDIVTDNIDSSITWSVSILGCFISGTTEALDTDLDFPLSSLVLLSTAAIELHLYITDSVIALSGLEVLKKSVIVRFILELR